MDNNLLYENDSQKQATERVLATLRIKNINKEIDELLAEVIKYAGNIDTILKRNNQSARYLEKVSTISDMDILMLDSDLENIDFRVKEVVEDLIKRINTRINIIKNDSDLIEEIESTYDLTDVDLDADIKEAKLTEQDFN